MCISLASFHNTLTVWCLLTKNTNSQFVFNSTLQAHVLAN